MGSVVQSSGSGIILRSVRELGEAIRVHGATPPVQALLVSRFAAGPEASGASPTVVLCPSEDAAADFASDLETLSARIDGRDLSVCLFPGWEQSPYSSIAPSIRTRLTRLSVLHEIVSAAGPTVIVTTPVALAQATIPPELFRQHTILIEVDSSVESREALARRLVESGYLRVDTVEDPGTFAVRGDIVDVFSAGDDRPARVELFGDVVERIRWFDSQTQRAFDTEGKPLGRLVVPPAREVLIHSATSSALRERLKERADDQGIPRKVRDPLMTTIQHGGYPDHSDAWAPFAYDRSATLLDYLADPRFVWVDELSCEQRWDEFVTDQKKLAEEAVQAELILPPVEALYPWTGGVEKSVRNRTALFLDRIELANLEALPTAETGGDVPEGSGEARAEQVSARHRVWARTNADLARSNKNSLEELEPKFKLWLKQGFKVVALASTQSQIERIRYLIEEHGFACVPPSEKPAEPAPQQITLAIGSLSEGFRWPAEGLVVLTEEDILGAKHVRKQRRAGTSRSGSSSGGSAAKNWSGLQALADLSVSDLVVHVDHGIGRYQGLARLNLLGAPSDYLQIEYANRDKLYIPVYRLNVIQKYAGAGAEIALDKLGSKQFAETKDKVKDAVRKLAVDLVQIYAQRKVRPGVRYMPADSLYREFEARFPFDETPDQLKAIEDVGGDLESGRSMDRLVCGDVGYGKTEVAIRAAFRAVSNGKQVAVLVPTTVLAFQHEQSFRARMKDYPITIESISRFKTPKQQKAAVEGLKNGKVDIVIGTHRLLSRDIEFRDLGLVIVDEEHRFGVEHKEKLKTLKINTHVLTLTATPIPRTLHMSLSGLRDISLINTAPVDRLPIRTYVSKYEEGLIQRAIDFELSRGGQVFYLHNRVDTIHEMARTITDLCPQARVVVGHGQMAEGELEKVMFKFYQKEANILVSTTIIESGLDVPSANTIIINRADMLGLAQLYQIRGRVGRGQQRGYAYLLIPSEGAVTEDAKKRLEVIQRFVELGSGFSIASHDLEIRGGGDLLGANQSGHINSVGFDLYTELLEEAIQEIEGKPLEEEAKKREPEIKAPFASFLGEGYVPDIHQRLSLYRRFSAAASDRDLDYLEEELRDRFGPLPVEAQNLIWLIRIKIVLKRLGIDVLTVGQGKVSMVPGPVSKLDPIRAIAVISSRPDKVQLTPDSKVVATIPTGNLRDLYFALDALFKDLT